METHTQDKKLAKPEKEKKPGHFQIVKLEERIAPSIRPGGPVMGPETTPTQR